MPMSISSPSGFRVLYPDGSSVAVPLAIEAAGPESVRAYIASLTATPEPVPAPEPTPAAPEVPEVPAAPAADAHSALSEQSPTDESDDA